MEVSHQTVIMHGGLGHRWLGRRPTSTPPPAQVPLASHGTMTNRPRRSPSSRPHLG